MKRFILFIFATTTLFAQAQTDVFFKISHKLGSQTLTPQVAATNNLNNTFKVSRLQYYVSNIILIHDSGTETPATGVYILVDAKDSTDVLLGNFAITNLEAVRFSIGVDAATNHLDPALYAASHPLAPKSPAMHWGWSSGYRFVAMEGKTGPSMNYTYEIHALEDVNYFTQTIATTGISGTNKHTVSLVADYTQALFDINIGNGEVNHGSTGSAADLLRNFAWRVFKSSEGNAALGLEEDLINQNITVSPNPTNGLGFVTVLNAAENSAVVLTDVLGKSYTTHLQNHQLYVANLANGLYLLQISQPDGTVATEKVIVAQ